MEQNNYEKYSHIHCWNQEHPSACGIPLEKHTQCCLCSEKYNNKTNQDFSAIDKTLDLLLGGLYYTQITPNFVGLSNEQRNSVIEFFHTALDEAYDRGAMEATNVCNLNLAQQRKEIAEQILKGILEKIENLPYKSSAISADELGKFVRLSKCEEIIRKFIC